MPIEFEAVRNKLEADRSSIISETVELISCIVEDNEKGRIEDLDSQVEHGRNILQNFITLGSLIEFLNEEERSIRKAQEEHESIWKEYIEGKESAIRAKLEDSGIDFTEVIGLKEEVTEPEAQPVLSKEDEEEKKRIGIERIRKSLGNVEAFKTGETEVDQRLQKLAREFIAGETAGSLRKKLDQDPLSYKIGPTVADLVSQTEEQILSLLGMGSKGFVKMLEKLQTADIVPDEKWVYVQIVDIFLQKEGLNFSPDARIALMGAALEASRTGSGVIAEEHLFLGLPEVGSLVSQMDPQLVIDSVAARREIYRLLNVNSTTAPVRLDHIELTLGVIEALKHADDVRIQNGREAVDILDIALGIFTFENLVTRTFDNAKNS